MFNQPEDVDRFVDRIFHPRFRRHACRATNPDEFAAWQAAARPAYRRLLSLDAIEREAAGHKVRVTLEPEVEDLGAFTRGQGAIETEPDVWTHFWLLKPKGNGPFPLAVMPHGHGSSELYAGVWHDETDRKRMLDEDRDVAVQAAGRGFLAIAPATRGMAGNPRAFKINNLKGRPKDCLNHNLHAMMAGRSMAGERVWDLMRIIDWGLSLPETDPGTVLMLGNSGGGMATLRAAAADERISIAICSSAYNCFLNPARRRLNHCACNYVPGMMRFGEYWDVAGLIAPRYLLTVNGRTDPAHPVESVRQAAGELARIYAAAGVPRRYEHAFGEGGHRFYKDIMWDFVERMMADRG